MRYCEVCHSLREELAFRQAYGPDVMAEKAQEAFDEHVARHERYDK